MSPLVIQLSDPNGGDPCGLCGGAAAGGDGPRLCLSDTCRGVCRACGNAHAPALVALLDLAQVATRVGRIGRHTLVPSMELLLELNRAAEQFADVHRKVGLQAA